MAVERGDKIKSGKITRLSSAASFKIGGREYSSNDVDRFKQQTKEVTTINSSTFEPRQISKPVINQSGVIHTSTQTFVPNSSVHSQGERYKPSVNTQVTVNGMNSHQVVETPKQSGAYPYNVMSNPVSHQEHQEVHSVATPSTSVPYGTPSIQTGSEINSAAVERVVTQTESYYSNNAYTSGINSINHGTNKSPENVSGVQTSVKSNPERYEVNSSTPSAAHIKTTVETPNYSGGVNPVNPATHIPSNESGRVQGEPYRASISNPYSVNSESGPVSRPQPVSSPQRPFTAPVEPSVPTSKTPSFNVGSIQTRSEAEQMAVNRVITQTERYNSNNAHYSGITGINHGTNKGPESTSGIKTEVRRTNVSDAEIAQFFYTQREKHFPSDSSGSRSVEVRTQSVESDRKISSAVVDKINSRVTPQQAAINFELSKRQFDSMQESIKKYGTYSSVQTGSVQHSRDFGKAYEYASFNKDRWKESPRSQFDRTENILKRHGTTSGVTTGRLQYNKKEERAFAFTASSIEKAKENAVRAKNLTKNFTSNNITFREAGRASRIVIGNEIKTEAKRAFDKHFRGPKKHKLISGAELVAGKIRSSYGSEDDMGSQTVSGSISSGLTAVKTFTLAQRYSPTLVKTTVEGVKKVGNGIYEVKHAAGVMKITIRKTADAITKYNIAPISKQAFDVLRFQVNSNGLIQTRAVQGIVHKVSGVATRVTKPVKKAVRVGSKTLGGIKKVYHAVDTNIRIIHGAYNGTIHISKEALINLRNRAWTGVKRGTIKTASVVGRKATQVGSKVVFRGIPNAYKAARYGALAVGATMMASEDVGTQAMGATITGTDLTIRTAVGTSKVAGKTVKTAVNVGGKTISAGKKTVKGVVNAYKFIQSKGLRAAWERARIKTVQALAKAGKSIVSLVLTAAKRALGKFVLPAVLIIAAIFLLMGGLTAPFTAIGTIFSGQFSAGDVEYGMRDYLTDNNKGVPRVALEYKQDLANQMRASANTHDIVRFYSNTGNSDVVEPTLRGVNEVFPSNEELVNMVHPMFNSIVLTKYDLEPTNAETQALLDELFNGLFRITTAETIEHCGQALSNGEGTVTTHSCGKVHALDDCPNFTSGTHTSYTCTDCCRLYCPGHPACDGHPYCRYGGSHTVCSGHYNAAGVFYICEGCITYSCTDCATSYHNPGCYTKYCDTPCTFECSGYKYCNSHSVISYTLNLDGAYALENKYFLKPIDNLANKVNRTPEEEKELINMRTYYELYKELMSYIGQQYGGITMGDLSGVQFVNGSRVGNQAVIDLACSQVGQQGGQPYWSHYGFASRVEWCACFVNWCMRMTPSATNSYPTTANNAYCPTIAANFASMGQWGDRNFTDLVAGDTIFFDWEGDGTTDHIGLVIGHDGTYVYTVEGNSGDAVAMRKYQIGSSVIYGYGLMNY